MRASDADREQVVSRLRSAAGEGRLAADELEHRVSAALRARTYAELEATVADLPGNDRPRRVSRPARRTGAAWALSTVRTHPVAVLVIAPIVLAAAAMILAATVIWVILMVVVMLLSGPPRRRGHTRRQMYGAWTYGPWMYTRQRRGYGPPRRRARSYWA